MSTKIIVAGSRSFKDKDFIFEKLDNIISTNNYENVEIISGGAYGADRLGEAYAKDRGYPLTVIPAEWNRYGKGAGPIRNGQMADYARLANNGVLVAFPLGESKGTRNMIKLAHEKGLKVFVYEGHV